MPITQTRIISMINAATEYRTALISTYTSLHSMMRRGDFTIEAYHAQLTELANIITDLGDRYNAVISQEKSHFIANQAHNQRAREEAAIRRREMGIQPRRKRPQIINSTDLIVQYEFNASDHLEYIRGKEAQPKTVQDLTPEELQAAELLMKKHNISEALQALPETNYIEEEEGSLKAALEQHHAPRRGVIGELEDDEDDQDDQDDEE